MRALILVFIVGALAAPCLTACGDDEGGVYCCTYESRHTACGGSDWTDWESEVDEFNIDNYKDDWTPQRVCDKYTGSWNECSSTCCINGEYRNNTLTRGSCP